MEIDSLDPWNELMSQLKESPLVQITTCCLYSAEPLPKRIMTSSQFDPIELSSVNF